jgi:hypothetical protein
MSRVAKVIAPKRSPEIWSSGPAHHVSRRLSTPAVTSAARATPASLTASQRVRVTDWFQASWWVPVSSSPAISGAPQKMPISAGAAISSSGTSWSGPLYCPAGN